MVKHNAMSFEEARKVLWLRSGQRPLGELQSALLPSILDKAFQGEL